MKLLSRRFEAYSADEGIEIIDNASVQAIELRLLAIGELSIGPYGTEKSGRKRRINALEQLQEE